MKFPKSRNTDILWAEGNRDELKWQKATNTRKRKRKLINGNKLVNAFEQQCTQRDKAVATPISTTPSCLSPSPS